MDGKNGLILWTLGGAGTLLLYSAYAKKSPAAVLSSTLGVAPAASPAAIQPRETADGGVVPGSLGARETADGGPVPKAGYSGGTAYLFDSNGNMTGLVPAPYQGNALSYIPPNTSMGAVNV